MRPVPLVHTEIAQSPADIHQEAVHQVFGK